LIFLIFNCLHLICTSCWLIFLLYFLGLKLIELYELFQLLLEFLFALFRLGVSWVIPEVHQRHDFILLIVVTFFFVEININLRWLCFLRVLDSHGPKLMAFAPAVAHVYIHRVGFELGSISKRIFVKETVTGLLLCPRLDI
jgi:hypothetical protein